MSAIRSLHGRLIVATGLAIGITLVGSGYLYTRQQNTSLERFHVETFSAHSQSIMEAFSFQMAIGGMDSVRQVLEHETADADIADIKLVDPGGKVIISASGLEGTSNLDMNVLDSVFKVDSRYSVREGGILSLVTPIGNSPRCYRCHSQTPDILGYLEVAYRFDPSERDYTGFFVFTVGLAVFFAIAPSLL